MSQKSTSTRLLRSTWWMTSIAWRKYSQCPKMHLKFLGRQQKHKSRFHKPTRHTNLQAHKPSTSYDINYTSFLKQILTCFYVSRSTLTSLLHSTWWMARIAWKKINLNIRAESQTYWENKSKSPQKPYTPFYINNASFVNKNLTQVYVLRSTLPSLLHSTWWMASIACKMNLNKRPNFANLLGITNSRVHKSLTHPFTSITNPLCQNSALFWWPQNGVGTIPTKCLLGSHRKHKLAHQAHKAENLYKYTPIWQDQKAGVVSTYSHVSIELGGGCHFCQTECVFGDEVGAWATWGSRWFGVLCLPWLGSRGCIHRSE